MKNIASLCLLFFSLFLNESRGQDRFLRKAKAAMEEGDVPRSFSFISSYESKSGPSPESYFMRHLVNKRFGKTTAQLDESFYQLKFAIANHFKLSPGDQQDWCTEIGFCANQFNQYQRECDSAIYRVYAATNNLDTVSIFISRYPQNALAEDARILRSSLAFGKALEQHDEDGYQAYLREYGKYPYADSARQLMWKSAFEKAVKLNRIDAYENFIGKYPQALQVADAKTRLWELAWKKIDAGKKSEYQSYLARYPQSPYAGEAKSRLEDFDWQEIQEHGDIPAYENFLANYPSSVRRQKAETVLQELIANRDRMKLLAEAESGVSHNQFYQALELLNEIDSLSPAAMIRTRDSLIKRIAYLRPLLNRTLGRYLFKSKGIEGVIVLGVDADSALFSKFRIFKDGEEFENFQSDGTFEFGPSGNRLDIVWDLDELNATMSPLVVAQEQRLVVLRMKNGTIYKKVSTDYLAEIVPSVKSETSVPNKKSLPPKQRPIGEKKKYVCENTWQDFGDIADQLERITPDWKYYVEKKVRSEYREGVDDIEITGASAKGVYLNATGNSTGTLFKVLWTCNGSIIIYDTISEN